MLMGIYAVYTNGLGIKNATAFDIMIVTLGVSHCKYTLIFHFRNKFMDFKVGTHGRIPPFRGLVV